jgi:hypothetical protein
MLRQRRRCYALNRFLILFGQNMASDSETLQCSTHGESQATYICEHLAENAAQRWHCEYPGQDSPWPDAWCDLCNAQFLKQGAWNDAHQGLINIKLLCSSCYESRKGDSISQMDAASRKQWEAFESECCKELITKNERLWHRLSPTSYKRWDWNQDTAELVFSNDGVAGVIARISFVGSFSTKSETWLWAWANFSLVEAVREPAIGVREYGEKNGFLPLTIPKWSATQEDGWHMAAVAARILGGEGAYRTPSDNGFTFMVLHDVRSSSSGRGVKQLKHTCN